MGPSKSGDSARIISDDGYDMPKWNASENLISLDEASDPYPFQMTPTESKLVPPTSGLLWPVSPIAKDVYPPSTMVSLDAMVRNEPSPGTTGQHQVDASGYAFLGPSPLHATSKELNNTNIAFTFPETCLSKPAFIPDSMELSRSKAGQLKDIMSEQSLRTVHHLYKLEGMDAPSVSSQSHLLRTQKFNSAGSIHSSHFNESLKLSVSSPVATTITQARTSQPGNSVFLHSVPSSASPLPSTLIESRSQPGNHIRPPSQRTFLQADYVHSPSSTRPATAFRESYASRPFNPGSSVVTEPEIQKMGESESDTGEAKSERYWDALSTMSSRFDSINGNDRTFETFGNAEMPEGLLGMHEDNEMMTLDQGEMTYALEHPVARPLFPCPDNQLQSPHDKIIAAITSELGSTSSQSYSDHDRGQLAKLYSDRGSASSETLSMKKLPHCFNHGSLLASDVAPKQEQIQELRELFYIVNKQWMQRMNLCQELFSRCYPLSQSNLFERAVRTLKNFTCGVCAQTFEDVFAIMHFAFAAAFLMHWQHDFYSWNAFCDDALQWQHALSSDEDKVLFLDAMSRWWLPELECTPLFHGNMPQGTFLGGNMETLSSTLRGGEVFQVCIEFLDSKSTSSRLRLTVTVLIG